MHLCSSSSLHQQEDLAAMKRGRKQRGGPAPSKTQQLARQRLSAHDPARAAGKQLAAKHKLLKQRRKAQQRQGPALPLALEEALGQMEIESQPEPEPRAEALPAPAAQAAAAASEPQQQPPRPKKKGKRRKASQLERIAMEVAQTQVRGGACGPALPQELRSMT